MVSGKNIWGRKGKLGSSEEKERKGEERNEENRVADFGVDLGSAYDGAGGACGGTGGGGRGRPGTEINFPGHHTGDCNQADNRA